MNNKEPKGTSYDDITDRDGYLLCTSRFDGNDDHWKFLRYGLRAEAESGKTLEDVIVENPYENIRSICEGMIARGVTLAALLAFDAEHLAHCHPCIATRSRNGETELPPLLATLAIAPDPFRTRERVMRDIAGIQC